MATRLFCTWSADLIERLLSIKTTADNGNGSEVKNAIFCSPLSQYTRNASRCKSPVSCPSWFFTVAGTMTKFVVTVNECRSLLCAGFCLGFPAPCWPCGCDCPVCGCGVGLGGGLRFGACAGAAVWPGCTGGLLLCCPLSAGAGCCARAGSEKSNTMPKAKRARVIQVSVFHRTLRSACMVWRGTSGGASAASYQTHSTLGRLYNAVYQPHRRPF